MRSLDSNSYNSSPYSSTKVDGVGGNSGSAEVAGIVGNCGSTEVPGVEHNPFEACDIVVATDMYSYYKIYDRVIG